MLDPAGLLLLSALGRSGGVRRAAADLGVPRSTVSRRLAELEREVGAPLVVRTSRRFALTELGSALVDRANRLASVLEESEELVRRAKAEPTGTLRIAVAPVLGEQTLPEILSELTRRFPRLVVDARLSAEYVDLRRGDIDVALRAAALDDASDVFVTRLGSSTTGCFASPSYLREQGTPKSPKDLASHECILVSARSEWKLRDQVVRVGGRVRVDNFRVARDLAVSGVGILWAATSFVEPLVRSKELIPILERHWSTTPIFAVHAGASPPPAKVRAFIEVAKPVILRAFGG